MPSGNRWRIGAGDLGVQKRRGSFEGPTQEDLKARICKETPKSKKGVLNVSGSKGGK